MLYNIILLSIPIWFPFSFRLVRYCSTINFKNYVGRFHSDKLLYYMYIGTRTRICIIVHKNRSIFIKPLYVRLFLLKSIL